MREIYQSGKFKRDLKRIASSGRYRRDDLLDVVKVLAEESALDPQYRDHALSGNWASHRECHIKPDWLLIYKLEPGKLILVRTGTHSELF